MSPALINPLVVILLFAPAVSALTGDVPSFVVIAAIVLMSVILDVTQERQGRKMPPNVCANGSRRSSSFETDRASTFPQRRLVPGDVIFF